MNSRNTAISILICLLFVGSNLLAVDIPPRPNPPRLVNDLANILDEKTEKILEWNLRALNDSTSNQIVILTVNTLDGYAPSNYAYSVGENWKVGQKDFDNGIVILVKPKRSSSDKGQAFIAVGYGLEGAIPDAIAKRIVENEMIPYFRNKDYNTGVIRAAEILSQFASGEINADGYNAATEAPAWVGLLPFIIIIIIVLLMRTSGARASNVGRSNMPFWTALWLGSSLGGGNHSGSWNSFSGGSGGSGFGGGFGGFGGGSFGGGGAGGSW